MVEKRHLVLLVDGDRAVREALQFALELEGLAVRVHTRNGDLLDDPDLETARCVVLDDRDRGREGVALLHQLKLRNVAVPSIMLASHLSSRMRESAREAGVGMILEKPLMDNTLRDHIKAIIASRSSAPPASHSNLATSETSAPLGFR